jgi:NADPH:quinone reductase-like Zn-dependent oxidoreductase
VKAAVHAKYDPPDVVRISDVEKPTIKDNDVLVKVHATTVNRTDCGFRAAKPSIVRFSVGVIRPRVVVLGNEFAGEVEEVGGAVHPSRSATECSDTTTVHSVVMPNTWPFLKTACLRPCRRT